MQRIGPDENAGVVGWQYRVNHAAPAVGADQRALGQGDSVLWYYGAPDGARGLDVPLGRPGGGRRQLQRRRHELQGRRRGPAGAGTTVTYGGATATADAAGRATFVAQAAGTRTVSAT